MTVDPLSLSDCLKTGPNMIPDFLMFLLNFHALMADIELAFLMIAIVPQDRDVLRFLWYKDPLILTVK